MNDPADDIQKGGTGVTWRLKRAEEREAKAWDGSLVFELADTNDTTLISISIPAERIEELLRPHFSIFAELQLDGTVFLDSELFVLFPSASPPNLLEMVRQALAPEMIEDEPNLKFQLRELRRKLTEALGLVDKTLADLGNPET